MKRTTLIGGMLIAFGIIALAYQGITYTTREKAIDLGPLQVTRERTERIPLPPVLGALALVGGVVVLVMGSRR
jgi:uncharacterized membrane protein YidH (DUF202 family)